MKVPVVLCLVLVCCLTQSHGTFAQFMSNLPAEVGHAFEVAWASITDAIKKPVKTRRLRPAARRRAFYSRTTPQLTTIITSTEEPRFKVEFKKLMNMPTREYKTTTSSGIGVKIPLIDKPLFRSIYEWRQLQKPQKFANHIRVAPPIYEPPEPVKKYKEHYEDYNTIFGPIVVV